jgi:peptidoglycan/xylan/chitin deacetylase (PgdA/CDA1 family)
MYSYRLTKRGKLVLFTFLTILISSFSLKGISFASDDNVEIIKDNISKRENVDNDFEIVFLRNEIQKLRKESKQLYLEKTKVNQDYNTIKFEDIGTYEKKVAFLTFDDGPSHNVTPLILTILDEYNVKATFFVLGNMIEKNGDVLKDINDRGHSIGIHSYSHESDKLLISKESFINEIRRSEEVIKQNLGENFSTRLFRFPGGSFEDNKIQYINDLYEAGYINVDWNALTADAEYRNPEPKKLMDTLKYTTRNKDKIIVLMHDATSKAITAEILPDVIEFLRAEGYEFALLK